MTAAHKVYFDNMLRVWVMREFSSASSMMHRPMFLTDLEPLEVGIESSELALDIKMKISSLAKQEHEDGYTRNKAVMERWCTISFNSCMQIAK